MGIYKIKFFQNFDCVIIQGSIDTGTEYFLDKVVNLDFFCQNYQSFVPIEHTLCWSNEGLYVK